MTDPGPSRISNQNGGVNISDGQVNAGGDVVGRDKIVNIRQTVNSDASVNEPDWLVPKNVKRTLKWRLTSTSDVIEFTLASPHVVEFFFKETLGRGVINLAVDGVEVLRDTFPMPQFFKSINYGFQVEGANCLLRVRMILFMAYHRITIGGRKL